jgi:UDP-2,3-diacylglucosamine pyrophosphatase LpxH
MLVVVSDLHLTDGTSGETIRSGAFRVFASRLRDMAYDASWRRGNRYKPIEEIHLVLLGDILDVIRSDKWLKGKPRPWDKDVRRQSFVSKVDEITEAILAHNKDSLTILKRSKESHKSKVITVPPAGKRGPKHVSWNADAPQRVPVPVKIYYMEGNHDWFFHLPGPGHNKIRKKVIEAMGLENSPTEPFPHDLSEVPQLRHLCEEHGVYLRHGDIYDPFNFEKERNASSLGDAIVVELLNRFPREVKRKAEALTLPPACLEGLKEIDNVRPLLSVPAWIRGLLRRTCDETQRRAISGIWDNLVDDFLQLDFVKERDSWFPFDLVDELEVGLKLSKAAFSKAGAQLFSWINRTFGEQEKPNFRDALKEAAFRSQRARYIVYGHTHHPKIVPLDISFPGGRALAQMYLNSGTWRQVHELARRNPDEEEFLGYYVMTYLAFYRGDERRGRPFESWSGSMAGSETAER